MRSFREQQRPSANRQHRQHNQRQQHTANHLTQREFHASVAATFRWPSRNNLNTGKSTCATKILLAAGKVLNFSVQRGKWVRYSSKCSVIR